MSAGPASYWAPCARIAARTGRRANRNNPARPERIARARESELYFPCGRPRFALSRLRKGANARENPRATLTFEANDPMAFFNWSADLRVGVAEIDSQLKTEENLMKTHKYPQSISHAQEHQALVKSVLDLQKAYNEGKTGITLDTMNFLKNWLSHHILQIDKQLGKFLNGKGVQ
jgi:hemerythrin